MKYVNPFKSKAVVISLLALLLTSTSSLNAQESNSLFSPLSKLQLKQHELSFRSGNKIDREVISTLVSQVDLDNVSHSTMKLSLPINSSLTLTATRTLAYQTNTGSLVWQGKIISESALSSKTIPGDNNIILIKTDKSISATIKYNQRLFKLLPTDRKGIHLLNEINQNLIPSEHTPDFERSLHQTPGSKQKNLSLQQQAATALVRLIIGYTTEAKNQNPDMVGLIDLAIAETNQGYRDSGVNAQVELAYSYELNYAESGDHGTDLDRFHAPNDGYMDEIYSLRDQNFADVSVILIGDASACGRARAIGATKNTAFVVVKDSCATGNYSFGHELGHLMRARHNPEADSSSPDYAFAHGFRNDSGGWRSIMSYACSPSCTRQNFWSDPTRTHQGEPRGTAARHDNARVLNLEAATVAAFAGSPIPIDNPPVADFSFTNQSLSLTVQFTSSSTDVEGPIMATQWNFGDNTASTLTSPEHTYAAKGTYTVTLTVTDSAGQSNSVTKSVTVDDTPHVNELPGAAFVANADGLRVNFIDQSTDTDGSIASWSWNFGDGATSAQASPEHIYASKGTYNVSLIVSDNEGGTGTTSQTISVDVVSVISSVDFEAGLGDWVNIATGDSYDWTRNSGTTRSSGTGPNNGAGGAGFYVYMETSNNQGAFRAGESVILEGPMTNGSGFKLSFDYHMYGSNIGSLNVDVFNNNAWTNNVWSITGQQQTSNGAGFQRAEVDLSAYTGQVKFRLRAVAAGGFRGDIAVDNIELRGAIDQNPVNQAPVITPLNDQSATIPVGASNVSVTLTGEVTDDGLPNNTLTCNWSENGGVLAQGNTVTASFNTAGTYTLVFSCSDSELAASDSVDVVVNQASVNNPPTTDAGVDQSVTLAPGQSSINVSLDGSISDDGQPNGTLTSSWSGPSTVSFANINAAKTMVTIDGVGSYQLTLTASDGEKSASDTVNITVVEDNSQPPVTPLSNEVEVGGISSGVNQPVYYSFDVPSGSKEVLFELKDGSGDADMYVKFGSLPTLTDNQYKSEVSGKTDEKIEIKSGIQTGNYYIMIYPKTTISNAMIKPKYAQ